MLKIKDNVNLKKLEKYGFELRYSQYDGKVNRIIQVHDSPYCDPVERPFISFFKKQKKEKNISQIPLYSRTREFDYHFEGDFVIPKNPRNRRIFFDTLYDLIKDGIVEKVEE